MFNLDSQFKTKSMSIGGHYSVLVLAPGSVMVNFYSLIEYQCEVLEVLMEASTFG